MESSGTTQHAPDAIIIGAMGGAETEAHLVDLLCLLPHLLLRRVDDGGGQPQPVSDVQRVGAAGQTPQQAVGGGQPLLVKLHTRILKQAGSRERQGGKGGGEGGRERVRGRGSGRGRERDWRG